MTKNMLFATIVATIVAAGLSVSAIAQQDEPLTALVGATVHPVDGETIENGTVLIRGRTIEAVGDELVIDDDDASVTVVDLDGRHIYPGFVHPASVLGLIEISSVDGTMDQSEMGAINPAVDVEVAFNHDSELLPVSIAGGIVATHTAPTGGLIRGTSAVMEMDGWSWEDMIIKAPAGMHIDYPAGAVEDDDNDDLKKIVSTLDAARAWRKAHAAWQAGDAPRPARNDALEALAPVLAGEMPVFLHAGKEDEIDAALDWAGEQGLERVIVIGGPDLQYAAERLASENVPVILSGVYTMPTRRWEPYDMAFVAASKLHEAGVKFAIAGDGSTNARNLPFHAGSAAAFGLPRDAALKSVTLWPAEILGIDDQLGSITPGKRASLIVTDGDPLEPMTSIERVWLDGEEYELGRSKHRQLYQRYKGRIEAGAD
ncbi:MAG: amidohydrolase family protein [Candidatus Wenzhouxiangella sp. M2_3B_020]